jgi:hypothetical protein
MAFTDMDDLRTQRNAALAASDWAVLPDSPLEEFRVIVIKIWRQDLRDFPSVVDQDDLANAELPASPDPAI